MKLRRLAALVSAAVLALGMVTAVSATDNQPPSDCEEPAITYVCEPEGSSEPEKSEEPDRSEEPEKSEEPEGSVEPTDGECQDEQGVPIECASDEPETSDEPEGSVEPEESIDGEVAGLTSDPTLPPTDSLTSNGTSGPDGTLPLVLIVLGVIGLAAVVLTPARAKR